MWFGFFGDFIHWVCACACVLDGRSIYFGFAFSVTFAGMTWRCLPTHNNYEIWFDMDKIEMRSQRQRKPSSDVDYAHGIYYYASESCISVSSFVIWMHPLSFIRIVPTGEIFIEFHYFLQTQIRLFLPHLRIKRTRYTPFATKSISFSCWIIHFSLSFSFPRCLAYATKIVVPMNYYPQLILHILLFVLCVCIYFDSFFIFFAPLLCPEWCAPIYIGCTWNSK